MLSLFAGALLIIGVSALVGAVAYGIFGYSEDQLDAIRGAESVDQHPAP